MSAYKNRNEVLAGASLAANYANKIYDDAEEGERDSARKIADKASRNSILLHAKEFNENSAGFDQISKNLEAVNTDLNDAIKGLKKVSKIIDGVAKGFEQIEKVAVKFLKIAG